MNRRKVSIIGGGGARTPLLIHGLAEAQDTLDIREVAIVDADAERAAIMAELGREIAGSRFELKTPSSIELAIEGADFVLSSIRVGGIEARARDERIMLEHGYAGQETTGPAGLAMALRTVPVALQHARLVERLAPDAWLINFTNPAGLITQALMSYTKVRAIGICDTPSELFHRIAASLGEPFDDLEFLYAGLNHLGWVREVLLRGENVTPRLLGDDDALLQLYPARLFEPEMIRALGLIPTEYLFFYYARSRAYENQRSAGATRGEEILAMNRHLFTSLSSAISSDRRSDAIRIYKEYLNRRNASYFRLEAHAESALAHASHHGDPFQLATGYHRIALEVMTALCSPAGRRVVVNVRNRGSIDDLPDDDVVEVPALIDTNGPAPLATGALPESIRGLVQAVKAYERVAIRAAAEDSLDLAKLALLIYPIVGEWDRAAAVLESLQPVRA